MIKYTTVNDFKGYRHREDKTNMPAGFLVEGSQNVLTNLSERVQLRKGYTLDGAANTDILLGGINATYDWLTHLGTERNLRAYDDTLEYRYVDSNDVVTWRTLLDGFTSTNFQFAEFWDTTELIDTLLFVNGTSNIYEWSGAITTIASNTATTLTKQGATTWAEEGFYTGGTRAITINGVSYTYTGGEATTTLTGLTALPAFTVGAVCHQTVKTTANSSMTGLPATFTNSLISNLSNQIYIASTESRFIYISKINNYVDYGYATPRVVGEGARLTADGAIVALIPQEDTMYISAGKNWWYNVKFTLSGDNTKEAINIVPLKTADQQSAFSQNFVTKIKNKIAVLTNEVSFDLLGRIENIFATPELADISDSIRTEIDNTDFTGGSCKYHRNYIYVSAPADNKVLIFNMEKNYWEAPQILPIKMFSIIDGELYGHDANVPQTYKLFNGTSDNGNPIDARAVFSYQSFGTRENRKSFTRFYVEGYMSLNTEVTGILRYDYNGYKGLSNISIVATDVAFLASTTNTSNSLGKKSLGKVSLGGSVGQTSTDLPKFRFIKAIAKKDFFELQVEFRSNDIDATWELLAYGVNQTVSTSEPLFATS